jgi:NADPH:quinone reductase-like Zn-dependent oxidoreductase
MFSQPLRIMGPNSMHFYQRTSRPILNLQMGCFLTVCAGTDFAGTVAAVGSGIRDYTVGDRVLAKTDVLVSFHLLAWGAPPVGFQVFWAFWQFCAVAVFESFR